ncbi:MAG: acyl-CoA/acyl-ACP dehydrogenase [Deltaproteobacteria bacterium]|nr:acyl-CoA/acyl-ACP dehydrogenase [Deltaproteobacteria bacterium]MCL5277770.1 acyl-CoA/acyl-ACP dehydrogenase [Deltaproteobacteria bacterium]
MDFKAEYGSIVENDRSVQEVLLKGREFREKYIDPAAAGIDARMLLDPHYSPDDIMKKGCDYGFFSFPIPQFIGGGGRTILHSAVLLEELCSGCAGIGNIFGAHYLGLSGIVLSMDINKYDRFLREVVKGEKRGVPVIFSAAVTEPMAGTDVEDAELLPKARLMTSARKVKDGYVLNGRKVFISNGSIAHYNVVTFPLERDRPLETWTGFMVPAGAKGFSASRVELKMGQRAAHAAELVFEDCFVPAENRIGLEGKGMRMTEIVLGASRAPVAAIATGIARGAYERALDFSENKRSGGRRLVDKQWVQMKLADMYAKLRMARYSYLEAARFFDDSITSSLMGNKTIMNPVMKAFGILSNTGMGMKVTSSDGFKRMTTAYVERKIDTALAGRSLGLSSLSKFSCADTAIDVCMGALEIMGNEGAEERNMAEKYLRDAKLTQIYEGTNQLNRYAVYKHLIQRSWDRGQE